MSLLSNRHSGVSVGLLDTRYQKKYTNTIQVDAGGKGDYTTIQAAINAVTSPSSTNTWLIIISPGVYNETLTMTSKSYVHFQGAGKSTTIIERLTTGQVLTITSSTNVEFRGVSIIGATASNNTGATHLESASEVTFRDCYLEDKGTTNAGVACLRLNGASTTHLYDCRIKANATNARIIRNHGADSFIYLFNVVEDSTVATFCDTTEARSCYIRTINTGTVYSSTILQTTNATNNFSCYFPNNTSFAPAEGTTMNLYGCLFGGYAWVRQTMTLNLYGTKVTGNLRLIESGKTPTVNAVSSDIGTLESTVAGQTLNLLGTKVGTISSSSATVAPIVTRLQNVQDVKAGDTASIIQLNNATSIGQVIKGASSQSANLTEWQNSSGTVLGYVSGTGLWNIAPNGDFAHLFTIRAPSAFTTEAYQMFRITNSTAATTFFGINKLGRVGIGVAASETYHLNLDDTNNPQNSNNNVGFRAVLHHEGNTNLTVFHGTQSSAYADGLNASGHKYSDVRGFSGTAAAAGDAPITDMAAAVFVTQNTGSAAITNSYGLKSLLQQATGSTTNYYGFHWGKTGTIATITNQYGLYIESVSNGSTLNYAIYTNAGLNRLGDQLSIVGSADRIQLVVQGNNSQSSNLTEWQDSSGGVLAYVEKAGLIKSSGRKQAVSIKSADYTLTLNDEVVVFTATATATLPSATGSGQTYRVCNESIGSTITIDAGSGKTIKGSRYQYLSPNEDLIITDYETNKWV